MLPNYPLDLEASVQSMKNRLHNMMLQNSEFYAEEAAASIEEDVGPECATWLAGLSSTPSGQKLMDHLTHIEVAAHVRPSSSFEQTLMFRRMFMHGLSKKNPPFRLPKKFPKYIVIANLSGDKLFLYSSNSNLITLLTLGNGPSSSYEGVEQIIAKAENTENTSVLLCYSLPFQAGMDSLHWDCRLITKKGTKYNDKELACSSWDRQASPSASTIESEYQITEILEAQLETFANNVTACDIDVKYEKIDGIEASEVKDAKTAKLISLVATLQNERRKMMEDHELEIKELKDSHVKAITDNGLTMKSSFEKQADEGTRSEERVKEAEAEASLLRLEVKKMQTELQDLKSQMMLKDEQHRVENDSLESKISSLGKEAAALKLQLRKSEAQCADRVRKQDMVHQQLQDEAERKLQKAKQSEAVATQSYQRILAMERAFEGASNEKAALSSEIKTMQNVIYSYKFRLAAQLARSERHVEMAKKARLLHAECEEKMRDLKSNLAKSKEIIKVQKQENADLSSTIVTLEETISMNKRTIEEIKTEATKATEEDATSVECAIQTDILPETLQIGELESECVKLRDEISSLKIELGRVKSKGNKRNPPPASFLANEPPPNQPSPETQPPSQNYSNESGCTNTSTAITSSCATNATSNPSTDSVLEGTIKQLHLSLSTVTELARQCKSHEQSARDAWSKVHAYESMHPNPHQQQQMHAHAYSMPYVYMHGHGHGHGHHY